MSKYILSIDQGTTSTRACLFNKSGQLVYQAQKDFRQIYPEPGWVEHDPNEIWQTVVYCINKVTANISQEEIDSIGITNQRETVVVWDKTTGEPIYNAIVWQCRRTAELCKKLKRFEKKIHRITGLVLDPYFSATKINWILKNAPLAQTRLKENKLLCGTIDTFILWKLTDGKSFSTDITNASRTSLMNLKTGKWDSECLKIFGVPKNILPEIKSSNAFFGTLSNNEIKITNKISIHAMVGDQQAALFGQACYAEGSAKCTFGTGSFILFNSGYKLTYSKKGILSTVAWKLEKEKVTYALEGGAFICGAAIQWLRDNLGIISTSDQVEILANEVVSTEGVEFVPALSGLGAPYWDSEARGMISGLTRKSTKAHIARATLEALALQNTEIVQVMEKESGKKLRFLKTDGGAAKNNLLMQLQADYLQKTVERSEVLETTAQGAAFLSGLGSGFWKSKKELQNIWKRNAIFKAKIKKADRDLRMKKWQNAVLKTRVK